VVAYGALLPQTALDIPTHGWVNLHFSILPAWRGAAPVQAALLAGDDIVGASTFQIVRELDAGPVYGVLTERSRPGDTAGELLDRLSHSGAELLVSTLDGIADGTARAVPQPAEGISFAPKVTVEHSRIDFTQSASVVDRLIRSVTPEPGAWANFRGERVKIGPVRTVESAPEVKSAQEIEAASEPATAVEVRLEPGEVRVERRRVLVGTATLPVRLDQVQASGKKRMAATDWARGIRIEQGERFQ
jgi:methionyl-tRNA formyltransferase